MFSTMTMASSTTKPVEMVSAIRREVVERVAEQVHDAEGADDGERHGDGGDDGGAEERRKRKITMTTRAMVRHQLELHVLDRGADGVGAVGEDLEIHGRGQRLLQLGQQRLHCVDDADDVGAGLALDVDDDGGLEARRSARGWSLPSTFCAGWRRCPSRRPGRGSRRSRPRWRHRDRRTGEPLR